MTTRLDLIHSYRLDIMEYGFMEYAFHVSFFLFSCWNCFTCLRVAKFNKPVALQVNDGTLYCMHPEMETFR